MAHTSRPPAEAGRIDPYGRFLTPAEVAERMRVSTTTVLRWVHDGRLPAIRVSDRVYRIPVRSFEQFLAGRPQRRPAIVHREVARFPSIGADEGIPRRVPVRPLPDPPDLRDPPEPPAPSA